MANNLAFYNPAFYANEALIQLENAMGFAGRVHLGYDAERRSFDKGNTINIKRPSTFTVQDAPSTAQDLAPDSVVLTLDKWKEVKFKLSDQELAFAEERIIEDHIRPAAYALANYIDAQVAELATEVGWFTAATGPMAVGDITGVQAGMFNRGVPLDDESMMHFAVNGTGRKELLDLSAFSQHQGAGESGVETQRRGYLGQRFGFNFFASQNVPAYTAGALTGSPLLQGAGTVGATTITLDAGSLTGTVKRGDTFVLSGDSQRYAVTADATAGSNAITISISPGLKIAYADNAPATFRQTSASGLNLAFHKNWAALAFGKLPDEGLRDLGIRVATVTHPKSQVSIRSRIYAVGNSSEVHVALDVLFGRKTLDPNLAHRLEDA